MTQGLRTTYLKGWNCHFLSSFMFFLFFNSISNAQSCQVDSSQLLFDFDACSAFVIAGTNTNYEEFTAQINNFDNCPSLSVIGGHLFRDNPINFPHSCTPGLNESNAICVSALNSCNYSAESTANLLINLSVSPGSDGLSRLSGISFEEQAPTNFSWIDGESGSNNYPQLFGMSVYNGDLLVYQNDSIPTNTEWTSQSFDFSGIDGFETDSVTNYTIKLLSYCPIDNGSNVFAWDLENLNIWSNCSSSVDAGQISFDNGDLSTTICNMDGESDNIGIDISSAFGDNFALITSENNSDIITDILDNTVSIDLEALENGICEINLIVYQNISGLEIGNSLSDLAGCFDISNTLTIEKAGTSGGTIDAGPFNFCLDGMPDIIDTLAITGNTGNVFTWLVSTEDGSLIIDISNNISSFNFDNFGIGTCMVWGLSYSSIENLEIGNSIEDFTGCFSLSNPVAVTKTFVDAATITGGPFAFCVGDGVPDFAEGISISDLTAANNQWIVTDESGNLILALPDDPAEIDFDLFGPGNCMIWNLSFEGNLDGLIVDGLIENLEGCFDLSNSIVVDRDDVSGGTLTGGPFSFCIDGTPDFISEIELTGAVGDSLAWLITNADTTQILDIPNDPELIDFDMFGNGGICLLWSISYQTGLTGLNINGSITDLDGCFSLSNAISISKETVDGGMITGGPFIFCTGDGIADMVDGIILSDNQGPNNQYLVTDMDGNLILEVADDPGSFNFDTLGVGNCLIWHISYGDNLFGLIPGESVSNLFGCFDLSNSIVVSKEQVEGGDLSGGPFAFCVDDQPDFISGLQLDNAIGDSIVWVITNADTSEIIFIPEDPTEIDFNNLGSGNCLLWSLSFLEGIDGLEVGANPVNLDGCLSFSNALIISREGAQGGTITGGPFEFCAGDGEADFATGIELTGNVGSNNQWLITDELGTTIIALPSDIDTFNFDNFPLGICLIWNLAFEDGIVGLELGGSIIDLSGCFGLSNSITVTRTTAEGGIIEGGPFEFCVGNNMADIAMGINLNGNVGANSQWLVTDANGTILVLPPFPDEVDFDTLGTGTCLIHHLSFADGLQGLAIGESIDSLQGCVSLSNSIEVIRTQPAAGILEGGPYGFCVGDSIPDFVSTLVLTGNTGPNQTWVITTATDSSIIELTTDIESIDFNDFEVGTCLIWNISSEDGTTGIDIGNTFNDIVGCFNVSNPIEVSKGQAEGGIISGGPFNFCVGDGVADNANGIVLSGQSGSNSQWVVTDASGELILALPSTPGAVDFDGFDPGTCLLWHLSFEDGLTGLMVNGLISNLVGCFSFSNALEINKTMPDGGVLFSTPFDFCVGDGIPDNPIGIQLNNNVGQNFQWVITDELGETIIGLPTNIENVDFDSASPGICRIWHMSYSDGLVGLEINNLINDLVGCFDLSNAVVVNKIDCTNMGTTPIVINEIVDDNMVEILNVSNNTIDVSGFWFCQFPDYQGIGNLIDICGGDLLLDPGEILAIETTLINFNSADGELGLYSEFGFDDPDNILDYVEWGSTGHERSSVAVNASIWTDGDFAPAWTSGNALQYDGTGDSSTDWAESETTSICDENNLISDQDELELKITPNPTGDIVKISLLTEQTAINHVRIFNLVGKTVYSQSYKNDNAEIFIDLDFLREGRYILQVQNNRSIKSKMLIKID